MIPRLYVFNLRDEALTKGIPDFFAGVRLLIAAVSDEANHFLLQAAGVRRVFFSLHYRVPKNHAFYVAPLLAARVANVAPVEGQPYRWGRGRSDASIRQSLRNIFQPLRQLTSSLSPEESPHRSSQPQNGKSGFSDRAAR